MNGCFDILIRKWLKCCEEGGTYIILFARKHKVPFFSITLPKRGFCLSHKPKKIFGGGLKHQIVT